MKKIWKFIVANGTKIIGYTQITTSALAVADPAIVGPVFGETGLKLIILGSGILTAWRGHYNSQKLKVTQP